ncbi:MAG: threonine synthase [Alphaproteobacteria bacterium]|nr:threonine synthase [Alphaproteobacteria bacterium]
MRYVSTRGEAPELPFDEVLLTGLARDGGLYVPAAFPPLDPVSLRGLSYPDLAVRVMTPFLGEAIAPKDFARLVEEAYAGFDDPDVAPLRPLDGKLWLMELFHGPTLAFKDYALQVLGRLFDHVLQARKSRITVLGATSGDTGSAAIEACRDRDAIDVFILHPKGRISEVQRRQMTTVASANVHNLAIDGTFDDCQDLVKGMFNDAGFRDALRLSSVNSINWARILAQTVYYFAAALKLDAGQPLAFAVPTGNFGNVYAGYVAKRMGLPVRKLVIGTNRNDILFRFFTEGAMTVRNVEPSLSPAMDIQISSNFERFLFDLYERDGEKLCAAMEAFRRSGRLDVEKKLLDQALETFSAHRFDDVATLATIAAVHRENGLLIDPHTAIAVAAARAVRDGDDAPVVALASAHPAKFPDAVERATGTRPALPKRLADLFEREERMVTLPNDLAEVKAHVRAHARLQGAA